MDQGPEVRLVLVLDYFLACHPYGLDPGLRVAQRGSHGGQAPGAERTQGDRARCDPPP